jgi:hypothetical protein
LAFDFALVRAVFLGRAFFAFFALALLARLGWTRSGRLALPVERFHSSYVSSEISPFTSSSANFRRCALLLNGIVENDQPFWYSHAGSRAGQATLGTSPEGSVYREADARAVSTRHHHGADRNSRAARPRSQQAIEANARAPPRRSHFTLATSSVAPASSSFTAPAMSPAVPAMTPAQALALLGAIAFNPSVVREEPPTRMEVSA